MTQKRVKLHRNFVKIKWWRSTAMLITVASCSVMSSVGAVLLDSGTVAWGAVAPGDFEERVLVMNCKSTPQVWSIRVKPPIYATNNLRRRVGSAFMAQGEPIKVTGRVLDSRCVPVNQVLVEMWHADHQGIMRDGLALNYTNDRFLYSTQNSFNAANPDDRDMFQETIDPHFTGSGSCVTNMLGEYTFYTIMPGKVASSEPIKMMFSVHPRNGAVVETHMFFAYSEAEHDPEVDAELKTSGRARELVAEELNDEGGEERAYRFNIVLPDNVKYKRY